MAPNVNVSISNALREHLTRLKALIDNEAVPRTQQQEYRRELKLTLSAMDAAIAGRPPQGHLEEHRHDLTDCDKHYVGMSGADRDAGLPGYRLITKTLHVPGLDRPVLEFVASGPRDDLECYKRAASALRRGTASETAPYEPLPETAALIEGYLSRLRTPIAPAKDAPPTRPTQPTHDYQLQT